MYWGGPNGLTGERTELPTIGAYDAQTDPDEITESTLNPNGVRSSHMIYQVVGLMSPVEAKKSLECHGSRKRLQSGGSGSCRRNHQLRPIALRFFSDVSRLSNGSR